VVKQLWILAGANGSGKTTFYRQRLQSKNIPFINADQIAAEKFSGKKKSDAKKATLAAQEQVNEMLDRGETFCYETVFSHASKIDILAKAKSLGYEVNLIYIHLQFPELNKARVISRVKLGEHDVPPEKIVSRIPKTVKNIKVAIKLASTTLILDNSSTEDPFQQVATVENGIVTKKADSLPEWAKEILSSS
jgi:predicted ABC-type ATPase